MRKQGAPEFRCGFTVDGGSAHPQIRNICQTDNINLLGIDHTSYPQTRPQREDLTLVTSNNYITRPLLCRPETLAQLLLLTNKQ